MSQQQTTEAEIIAPEQETAPGSAFAIPPATPAAPAVASRSGSAENIMTVIAKLAENPNVDVNKIEQLMGIFVKETERVEAKRQADEAAERERLFYIDFVAMKPKLPVVLRTKENTHTKSTYAPLEEVNKAIDPILAEYGFATSAIVTKQTDEDVTMELSVIHKAGHAMKQTFTLPIDDKGPNGSKNKTTGQGIASCITTMKRVGFCAMLNISTGDDKDGNATNAFITPEQVAEIEKRISAPGHNKSNFLAFMGVDAVENIRASDYDKAIKSVVAREEKLKADKKK